LQELHPIVSAGVDPFSEPTLSDSTLFASTVQRWPKITFVKCQLIMRTGVIPDPLFFAGYGAADSTLIADGSILSVT
jgi:hypothetical protein